MNNITIQMNISYDELLRLKNGLSCYGYSIGYTTYPTIINVPIEYLTDILDLSEGHNEYYEYKIEYKIEYKNEEGINQLDPNIKL